jgi:hypothetical protein
MAKIIFCASEKIRDVSITNVSWLILFRKTFYICESSGSYGGENEADSLLGYSTV